jgi:hypothetical protein
MRIRSIKPEFWRSDDITALDWEARLIFIGLWSYVDDNGVGVDKLASIAADLFAGDLERDPRETFERVSRGLQTLSDAGRIVRYEAESKPWLSITNWSKHQRIDKPNKPRYPSAPALTRDSGESRDTLATPSRESSDWNRGTGEQRNRGTEDVELFAPDGAENVTDLFEEFYAVYPRHVGKTDAARKFASVVKTGKVAARLLVVAAERFAADPNLPEKKFIPHPATWLNQGRWEDEPMPARGGSERQAASLSLVERYQREEAGREEVGSGEAAGVRAIGR